MKIVEKIYRNDHWEQLYKLIRFQLQDVMPNHCIANNEIKSIIAIPNHYIDLKHGAINGDHQLYFALVGDEVIAATQIFFPTEEETVPIYWLVGNKEYQYELIQFVSHIKQAIYARGKKEMVSTRNPFGLGWSGCATHWDHLTKALLTNEFKFDDHWVNYLLNTELNGNSIQQTLDAQPMWDRIEGRVGFRLFVDETEVGEINVWFPTSHSVSLATMATIEYMEIKKAYRGRGLAEAGIQSIKKQLPHITNFMLWTDPDNTAMRKTAEKTGFQQRHSMYWYRG